jgi:chromosome partitioning protein
MSFNQAMISQLTQMSPNTVSRQIASLHIEPIANETSHNKRYSFDSTRSITNSLYASHKRPIKQKIQVFYNFKGGTGKTSLCYQVASHLAILGYKVLALDLDPQGHLSSIMRIPEDWNGPTIYDIVINGVPLEDALVEVMPGLDLLPANISMTRIEVPLSSKTKREEKLKNILDPMRDKYDYIIMDTNPTISTLNMNALVASDRVNVVCETQPFSLSGLRVLVEQMVNFYQDMGFQTNYCIVPNKYEIKTAISQEVLGALRSEYGSLVMSSVVRKSEDINAASKKKQPVSTFCKSKSTAFEDVMDLVHEIVTLSQIPVEKKRAV